METKIDSVVSQSANARHERVLCIIQMLRHIAEHLIVEKCDLDSTMYAELIEAFSGELENLSEISLNTILTLDASI